MSKRRRKKKRFDDLEQPQRKYSKAIAKDPELQNARRHIYQLIEKCKFPKTMIQNYLSMMLGWEFDMKKIKDLDEARRVYRLLSNIQKAKNDLRRIV